MKNLTWQQWTALGLIVAVLITTLVLHLVQPKVSFAFTEITSLITFALGIVCGYLFTKKKYATEKQLLTD